MAAKRAARIRWRRVIEGLLLVLLATGSAAGAAESGLPSDSWATGGAVLLGVLVVWSAVVTSSGPAPPRSMWGAMPRRLPSGNESPLLGELLVYKYQLITEAQLTKALARQRGTSQKLGEVLIEMGLVTAGQIAIALADQQSQGDPFAAKPEGEDPES